MFKKIISSTLAFLLFSASAFAAPDYSASRGYFRNATVTDIGTSGAYVDVSSSYSLDGERATVLILVRNTGTTSSAGNIVVKRQGGDNLTYVSGTLEKRCPPTDSAYVGIDASWATFNGAGYDLGTMASGRTCAIRYSVDLGATGNDFSTVSQDIATVYDNGSLVQTLTMNLYAPFFQAYQARNKGTSGDEIVLRFAETPFIDATNPTTHANSAANPNNYEINVNSAGYSAFSGTATYSSTNKEITLFPSTNLISTGDTVAIKIKNLKTDYGRFLNSANYTTASAAGLTSTTITTLDRIAPTITNALYSSSLSRLDIVFSEVMLTGFTNAVISVDNGTFDSPTLSWPTVSGYSAGQVLRLALGSGKSVTPGTTQFYFNPASSVTDLASNATTHSSSSKVNISAGSILSPEVATFTIADASTTSVTGYTNNQTVSITAFTGTSSGGSLTYVVTETSSQPASGAFGVLPTTFTLSGLVNGQTYTVYPWVKDDNAINSTVNADAFKKTIIADTAGPSFTVSDGANASWNQSDTITVSVSDALSGVDNATVTYALSADNVCSVADTFSSNTNTVTVSSSNTGYVCFRADDNLGNRTYSSAIGPLKVDTTAPTVTAGNISISGASGTGGAYKIGDTVTATWSNLADGNSDIASVTVDFSQFGGASNVSASTSNGGNTYTASYTVLAGAINGTTSRNVSVTAVDNAGNITTTADTANVTVDNVLPTLSSVGIASNNATTTLAKAGNIVTLSFTASETLASNPVVAIRSGGDLVTNAVTVNNPSGNNWTASYTVNSADTNGAVTFTINFSDQNGNTGTQVTAVTNASSVTVDRTAPTVAVNATSTNDTRPALSGTVNDATATINVNVNSANYTATNNGDGTWTLADNAITPALSNGTYSVTVTATDPSGNVGTDATSNELEIDTTLVSATVTYSSDPVKAGSLTITVVFGKAVSGTPTISINQPGTTDITNANLSNVSGNTWEYTYTVHSATGGTYIDGTATVSFSGTDNVGNAIATPNDPNFVIDTTAPTVTITSSTTSPTNDASIPVTITFNEDVTGFLVGDITVVNGTKSGFATVNAQTYTVNIAPTSSGAVTIDVASSVATDSAGNNNTAATQLSLSYDVTAPTLAEVTAIGSTTDSTPDYTFSSTEAGTLTLSGDCATGTTAVSSGNNTITFNSLGVGTHSNCTLTVIDTAGNISSSLTISSFTLTQTTSSGGGGGGGGGGASGPDTKTVYKMPASDSDKLVELIRPVQTTDGTFTRPVEVKEYTLGSTFTIQKGTEVTDLQNNPYTGAIAPIERTLSTSFSKVSLPSGKTLVYTSVFTVAGDQLLYSKPVDMKLILPASLKNYVENYSTFKIFYWVPNSLSSFGSLIVSTETPTANGQWKVLGGSEKVKDGTVSFSLSHSTYVVFAYDAQGGDLSGNETTGENTGGGSETPVSETQAEEVFQNLTDIKDHWAKDFIVNLYVKGVVKGQGDTKKFFPDDSINRAAFLKIVLALFNYQVSGTGENPFTDVSSSDWFAPYVLTAYKKGIVKGYEVFAGITLEPVTFVAFQDYSPAVTNLQNVLTKLGVLTVAPTGYFGQKTTEAIMLYQQSKNIPATGYLDKETLDALNAENIFSPAKTTMEFRAGQNINRAEALIIMFKATGITVPKATSTDFTDVPLDSWFADYVSYAKANGIVKGKSETRFAPADNITRAEAVKIAINMFEFQSKQ